MGDYRQLRVWQAAHQLACAIQLATQQLPRGYSEAAEQIRRAALSIPTNLAEGSSRRRDADYARYINIAIGSAAEVESLLTFLGDCGALPREASALLMADVLSIRRMLFKLRSAVGGSPARRPQAAPSDPEPTPEAPRPSS